MKEVFKNTHWRELGDPPHVLRYTLLDEAGKAVGTFEGLLQYRQKIPHGDTSFTPITISPEHRQEAEDMLASGSLTSDDETYLRYTVPAERVCFVSLLGIQEPNRAGGTLNRLFDELIPHLEKEGVKYLVGRFVSQNFGGDSSRVPLIYDRLGERLTDGVYWIPIEALKRWNTFGRKTDPREA